MNKTTHKGRSWITGWMGMALLVLAGAANSSQAANEAFITADLTREATLLTWPTSIHVGAVTAVDRPEYQVFPADPTIVLTLPPETDAANLNSPLTLFGWRIPQPASMTLLCLGGLTMMPWPRR